MSISNLITFTGTQLCFQKIDNFDEFNFENCFVILIWPAVNAIHNFNLLKTFSRSLLK